MNCYNLLIYFITSLFCYLLHIYRKKINGLNLAFISIVQKDIAELTKTFLICNTYQHNNSEYIRKYFTSP